MTTEFPAGGIERTDGKEYGSKDAAEAALDCAKRELREETGYESSDWTHLITVPSNATISDNYAYVFMARNCITDRSTRWISSWSVVRYPRNSMKKVCMT